MSQTEEEPQSPTPPDDELNDAKRQRHLESNTAEIDPPTRPPPRKRRRIVISCTECHRRKQKCDRKRPCTNCVSRNKQDACKYDTKAPAMKEQQAKGSSNGDAASPGRESVDSIPIKVANFGYSQAGASTLGFLRKIESANPSDPLSRLAQDIAQHGDHLNTRERYKSLIRQLPARTYIFKLVDIYFVDFNWQYYGLDRDVFDKQIAEWYDLPFGALTNEGPQALAPDLRVFPALLFQVLATALLVLPTGSDPTFDSLKYAGNMTFEDLAVDYSESGVAILSLLGKRQMSVTTVLAGFLRAAFLKYVALVTEAWHAIGSAIRDAQEIGLHRDSLDPQPASDNAEAVLETQWEIQRRRRLWMILVGWDVHTGIVLGRPTTINLTVIPPTLPVDAPIPKDRSRTPVLPRTENDPPTPLTRCLWAYRIMSPLRDILDLEKEGPCPQDFSKIDRIHQQLLELEEQTPSYFRLQSPDKRFDWLPECYWIPYVRATLPQLMSFNFMALHRPYIFTRPRSRTEALKASLEMLNAQRMHFQSLKPQQYKTFSLFFGTFDAIVLMASIYILFPKEHPELVQNAMQHFQWAVERFEAMSDRNALAKAALGVLQAICIRLKKSLSLAQNPAVNSGRSPLPTAANMSIVGSTPAPITVTDNPSPQQSMSGGLASTSTTTTGGGDSRSSISGPSAGGSTVSTLTESAPSSDFYSASASASTPGQSIGPISSSQRSEQQQQELDGSSSSSSNNNLDWTLPSNFDWSTIQPIFATGDLVYNDLVGSIRDENHNGSSNGSGSGNGYPNHWGAGAATDNIWKAGIGSSSGSGTSTQHQQHLWQFEGDFGNDSVWNLLNMYTTY